MAATAQKLANLRPQAICLNVASSTLVAACILQPSWCVVAGLTVVLAALCFRWTQEESAPTDSKRVDQMADELKTLSLRLGNLAFKAGFREK
jgi:hypothetical protein